MRQYRRRGQHGQSLLEFALVLIPTLMLIIGFLDIGLFELGHAEATSWADQAAQAGADRAALHGDAAACPTAQALASAHIQEIAVAPTNVKITCQVIDTANPRNPNSYGREGTRQVILTIQFQTHLLLVWWWPITVHITGSARIDRAVGP
jgi:Flp pilus assembly protein TadG